MAWWLVEDNRDLAISGENTPEFKFKSPLSRQSQTSFILAWQAQMYQLLDLMNDQFHIK